jgi:hypothetical protein
MKDNKSPDFEELSRLNEAALASRLDAVRAVLEHSGEKGRSLEAEAAALVREILPADYGLGTGFVAYRKEGEQSVRLSSQLDLVIYDAARCAPLARLGTCDVFPLEAVLAYVEVKAAIRSASDSAVDVGTDSLEYCLRQNKAIRELTTRRYWTSKPGTTTRVELMTTSWMPIRGFVIAFAAKGSVASDPGMLAQRMADYSRQLGPTAHLHGLFIVGKGYFRLKPVEPDQVGGDDQHVVEYVTEHALLEFSASLLRALARFPRPRTDWTPAIDKYYGEPSWSSCPPTTGSGSPD